MPRERVSEIASLGGRAAHAKGVAHRWTPEEASRAGRKGAFGRRRTSRPPPLDDEAMPETLPSASLLRIPVIVVDDAPEDDVA